MAPTAKLQGAILADVTLPDTVQVGSTAFCSLSVAGSPFSQALSLVWVGPKPPPNADLKKGGLGSSPKENGVTASPSPSPPHVTALMLRTFR